MGDIELRCAGKTMFSVVKLEGTELQLVIAGFMKQSRSWYLGLVSLRFVKPIEGGAIASRGGASNCRSLPSASLLWDGV